MDVGFYLLSDWNPNTLGFLPLPKNYQELSFQVASEIVTGIISLFRAP